MLLARNSTTWQRSAVRDGAVARSNRTTPASPPSSATGTRGSRKTVRADYLVGADGVHSPVRTALGIATSGYGALPIFVVFVYFRAPWRKFVAQIGDGGGVQVKNADAQGIFIAAEGDLGMFITTYFPDKGETADQFTPQRCREMLIKAIGEPMDIDIIEVAAWQPYEQVADQFHCGRVFLVGDSAHTMPPFKAGGANTAIQSAHNLAWKLAAVLQGTAGPALLGTYHTSGIRSGDSPLANRFLARRFRCSSSRTTGRYCRPKKNARCSR